VHIDYGRGVGRTAHKNEAPFLTTGRLRVHTETMEFTNNFMALVLAVSSAGAAVSPWAAPIHAEDLSSAKPSEVKLGKTEFAGPKIAFFWASWCESCAQWSDTIRRVGQKPGMRLITFATDEAADKNKIAPALHSKFGLEIKNAYWISETERKRLKVEVVPVVVLIDRNGKVDTIYEGAQRDKMEYFEKRLRTLL
jgi:thiol-disulfide isomerase/thioredoxin